jgi:hypothetical protein
MKIIKEKKQIFFLVLIIVIVWCLFQFGVFMYYKDLEESAIFGDSFGAINSLFTGLAFGGLIYTIYLQRKDLEIQREDLKETKTELKRSADAQEKSEKALTEQIKLMNVTAEINALNVLIDYYNSVKNRYSKGGEQFWEADAEQKPHLERLLKLLNNMKNFV